MILRFARPGGTIVTVEEGIVDGGAGSAVRELLDRESRFDVRFKAIGLPLEAYPLGKADEIRVMVGLDVPGLTRQIKDLYRVPLCSGGDERTRG
jgi:1-deoxy-D-xylulose-5-phosphate synthase